MDIIKCYNILNISEDSSYIEIKSAFRKKCLLTHPDKGGSDELFREVYEAFSIIKKKIKNKKIEKKEKENPIFDQNKFDEELYDFFNYFKNFSKNNPEFKNTKKEKKEKKQDNKPQDDFKPIFRYVSIKKSNNKKYQI